MIIMNTDKIKQWGDEKALKDISTIIIQWQSEKDSLSFSILFFKTAISFRADTPFYISKLEPVDVK